MQEIKIHLEPSKQFLSLMVVVMIGSLGIIFSLPFQIEIQFLLALVFLIYGAQILWQHVFLRDKKSIMGLSFNADGWHLHLQEEILPAVLLGESTLTRWVSILRFSQPDQRKKMSCVIWRDSISLDQFRQLRVVARWFK